MSRLIECMVSSRFGSGRTIGSAAVQHTSQSKQWFSANSSISRHRFDFDQCLIKPIMITLSLARSLSTEAIAHQCLLIEFLMASFCNRVISERIWIPCGIRPILGSLRRLRIISAFNLLAVVRYGLVCGPSQSSIRSTLMNIEPNTICVVWLLFDDGHCHVSTQKRLLGTVGSVGHAFPMAIPQS
jgi:hypothetical protein